MVEAAFESHIYAQRFAADGEFVGGEFKVNTNAPANETPSVAIDADGDCVVAWTGYQENTTIFAQRFNAAGEVQGGEFQVSNQLDSGDFFPSAAMGEHGDFVVAWHEMGGEVSARYFDSDGTPQGDDFLVNTFGGGQQGDPATAMNASGQAVIVWDSYPHQDGSFFGIFGQRFQAPAPAVTDIVLIPRRATA